MAVAHVDQMKTLGQFVLDIWSQMMDVGAAIGQLLFGIEKDIKGISIG